jgi:S1-C subfamily serine protease
MRSFFKVALPALFFACVMPHWSNAASAPETFAPLIKKEMPSVVNISTKQVVKVRQQSPFGDPQMDEFFSFRQCAAA